MKTKLYVDGREIDGNGVDYGDGQVMIQFIDNREVAVVDKNKIVVAKKND